MLWTAENTIPAIQGKSLKLRKLFAEVANAAIQKGRTESEAIFSAMAAVKNEENKSKNKKSLEKVKESLKVPTHLQAIIDATKVKKANEDQTSSIISEKALSPNRIKQAFLPDNSLEVGVDRSLVSADFDDDGRLVLWFDTGEKITTSSIHQTVENYISIVNSINDNGTPGTVDLIIYENNLSGFEVQITKTQHLISTAVSVNFYKGNKDISLDWEFSPQGVLIVRSNINLTGVRLVLIGK